MIPKQAIQKAIEGGWSDKFGAYYEQYGFWQVIALDPTFWQALGKALGWDDFEDETGQYFWRVTAYDFYYLILTCGDTERFWEELLK